MKGDDPTTRTPPVQAACLHRAQDFAILNLRAGVPLLRGRPPGGGSDLDLGIVGS